MEWWTGCCQSGLKKQRRRTTQRMEEGQVVAAAVGRQRYQRWSVRAGMSFRRSCHWEWVNGSSARWTAAGGQ